MSGSSSLPRVAKTSLADVAHALRRSQSLASMLPSLLLTGVITLLVGAVMRLLWAGLGHNFFSAWMEIWLTAWAIAFPVAYLAGPHVVRLAACISAPSARTAAFEPVGLALRDIEDASANATAKHDLKVRRKLKALH
ncbi:MAG: hypothetical protein V7642_2726 [Burkholderiales bacterium]|jgi:hypothetical protein